MSKPFHRHHHLLYSDPAGILTPTQFCNELMAPYGFTRMPVLFHDKLFFPNGSGGWDTSGPIDEDKFRQTLEEGADNGKIPLNSKCWINLEGKKHRIVKSLRKRPWYELCRMELDFFHDVLTLAQETRPDLKFGFFGQVPCAGFDFVLNPDLEEVREPILVACHPLAKRLGFLMPYFYDRFTLPPQYNTCEQRLKWIRTTLESCRRFFPESLVIGMTWPEYHDEWNQRPKPDTERAQKARRLSGYKWFRYNRLIWELADGWNWWGGSPGTPWDPLAEWVEASKELFETYGHGVAEGG